MDKTVLVPQDSNSDEIDLSQLIKKVWSTRLTVLMTALLFIGLFCGVLALKIEKSQPTFSQLIGFTFKGIEEGKYPNGDNFRLEDILAPSIINAIYEELNLAQTNMTLNELASELKIYPYSPERAFILQKYSSIINDKNRSDEDKAEARSNMAKELKNALNASARIEFSNSGGHLTSQQSLNIVSKIPKLWAQQAIFVRGVTKHEITLLSSSVIKNIISDTQSPLQQLSTLWNYFQKLKADLSEIATLSSATTARDDETNLTISDLEVLLTNLERQFITTPSPWTFDHEGSLNLNKSLYSPRLFDVSLVENLDYLVAVDVLAQRIQLVKSNLTSLESVPFASIATDPQSGLTLQDVNRLLQDMEVYDLQQLRAPLLELGISKDASRVPLYYNFRIRELERDRDALNQQVQAIQKAENRYITGGTGQSAVDQNNSTSNSSLGQTTTLIPQLGDAFLDKIIAMSEKGGDMEYRQDLNKDTIQLEQQAIELEKQINELKEYLILFTDAQKNKIDDNLKQQYIKEIQQEFPATFEKLGHFAKVSQRISNRLRYAQEIEKVFSKSEYKLTNDIYLQNISTESVFALKNIQNEMAGYANIAQRIVDKIDSDRYGVVNDLYRYLNEPQIDEPQLISKRDIMIFIGGLLASIIFSMFGHLAYQTIRSKD
ncbi:LPS biosynthesis protein [Marinomonas mediterranea]|jgi:hypothetical protein|uniref:Lipopolysaccharide biosynthesis protein n=1 Tax=Marinomonas mediterranea (strain ATCC 700492 / JCM 21426 / NBRC 103028 / MMB-1) TaxID=717774 RepID=F2K152_MARM1|nr:LPS biosynthesis protein [Marinomonas mediterranea]ADZ89902.1 lipopolysaccharide biosynthesis protein [Marinomonas mediterranea MMB-1]WCN07986.1 hypothetical protein GV055_03120 [Marinomonas mediterranea]WCN12081.1 hypothetical protein GV054_03130 [Marinomonas mediterranea]WCN16119.1 hypothetical protein GV053_03065 [Marinomonas mediterranea MMB-1]